MLSLLAESVLVFGLAMLAFPSFSDAIVLLSSALGSAGSKSTQAPAVLARLLVLIPAHDEERLLGRTVESVLGADYPENRRRVVVIADNCTDRTADVARESGAECLVRDVPNQPGKPQALAWAIERASRWPSFEWDACVIVDADSVVEPLFLREIGSVPNLRSVLCQARNGVENEWDSWLTVLGGLLVRARYDVLFQCKTRSRLNCPTAGNGTAVGRDLLKSGWQAFSLAEGWELYARATIKGRRSLYVQGARIASQEARSVSQSTSQRSRWSAGRWHVLTQYGRKIAEARHVSVLQRLDAICELSNPGPVSQVGGIFVLFTITLLANGPTGIAVALTLVGIGPYAVVYGIALYRHPRPWLAGNALARVPAYAIWRIPLAVRALLASRRKEWKKTERH